MSATRLSSYFPSSKRRRSQDEHKTPSDLVSAPADERLALRLEQIEELASLCGHTWSALTESETQAPTANRRSGRKRPPDQATLEASSTKASRLALVTRGATPAGNALSDPSAATVLALGGTIALEHPDWIVARIDLDPAAGIDEWARRMAEAEERARVSGRSDVADYLALRALNDVARNVGIEWLLAAITEHGGEANRDGAGIGLAQTDAHSFRVGNSTMVGKRLTLNAGVRSLTIEAGWPRTPRDGIESMRIGADAFLAKPFAIADLLNAAQPALRPRPR
jgi:hypothetical protein